jgi:hypothetical protein
MLGADEAIGIYWGADLTLLYNDAWRELIGDKHPEALGQPAKDVFSEIWETIGPMSCIWRDTDHVACFHLDYLVFDRHRCLAF